MRLEAFDNTMRQWLSLDDFTGIDRSLNGLQVGSSGKEIDRVAFAVDASLECFRRAISWQADLLLVHHGLFWGQVLPVTGNHYGRIKTLLDSDLALYAVHLPLDQHPELGNNAGIAKQIGLENLEPFGLYQGVKIGYKGKFPDGIGLEAVAKRLCGGREQTLSILPFGPEEIRSVGVVSGGGSREVLEAIAEGLDCYITGDADHTYYHHSLEGRINVISAGHYLTEVWGVKQLVEKVKESLGLETIFLDIPTGL